MFLTFSITISMQANQLTTCYCCRCCCHRQVINPNKFLPYLVAAITLVAHSRSTWGRLIAKFNRWGQAGGGGTQCYQAGSIGRNCMLLQQYRVQAAAQAYFSCSSLSCHTAALKGTAPGILAWQTLQQHWRCLNPTATLALPICPYKHVNV
jgi:hypothetical protein